MELPLRGFLGFFSVVAYVLMFPAFQSAKRALSLPRAASGVELSCPCFWGTAAPLWGGSCYSWALRGPRTKATSRRTFLLLALELFPSRDFLSLRGDGNNRSGRSGKSYTKRVYHTVINPSITSAFRRVFSRADSGS